MEPHTNKHSNSKSRLNWIWISGIAFLVSFLSAAVFIFFGKELENLGIIGNVYYIILIPLGFSSAAFLAGAMKSYASFKSGASMPYGQLNLTGPIVIFALVVGGGFIMPNFNKPAQFDVKMHMVDENNEVMQSLNEGAVTLYFGKNSDKKDIHDGEVMFQDIPESYNNKQVKFDIQLKDKSYKLADSNVLFISKNVDFVEVKLIRNKETLNTLVRGSIINEKGVKVKHAFINFQSGLATCYTNENGDFSLNVPYPPGTKVNLEVVVNDVRKFNEDVTLSSNTPINLKVE